MPDWLIAEAVENLPRRIYNPKPLKQTARVIINIIDKHLKKN